MKHLRNVVRGSRSVPRAPHIELCRVCAGFILYCAQVFSLNYHRLTYICAGCAGCAGFFKFAQRFFKYSVLFFKTNFKLNLPCTACTDYSSPYSYWLSVFSNPAQTYAQTLHKQVSTLHSEPRTTIRDPFITEYDS